MTAIVDYGVGNLFSLRSSLSLIGEENIVTGDRDVLLSADRIILPGVGAFGDAQMKLKERGLFSEIKDLAQKGKPLLGICLGMQLLFESSEEFGSHEGLSLIKGQVRPLKGYIKEGLDIPHMGWNRLHFVKESPVFKYVREGEYVYFVHSFAAFSCDESLTSVTDYSCPITASVQNKNVYGMQFHPEKSADTGMRILKGFTEAV